MDGRSGNLPVAHIRDLMQRYRLFHLWQGIHCTERVPRGHTSPDARPADTACKPPRISEEDHDIQTVRD